MQFISSTWNRNTLLKITPISCTFTSTVKHARSLRFMAKFYEKTFINVTPMLYMRTSTSFGTCAHLPNYTVDLPSNHSGPCKGNNIFELQIYWLLQGVYARATAVFIADTWMDASDHRSSSCIRVILCESRWDWTSFEHRCMEMLSC